MSPDTNGNPPSVVKRKKKINPNKKCVGSDCHCFVSSPACSKGTLPNVQSYSFGNSLKTQHLMTLPSLSTNCKNCLFSSDVLKNMQTPEFSDSHEYSSLPPTVNMQGNETSTARRFSDPGLPNDSDSSTSTVDESVIHKLKSQVNHLKENNHRLTREIEDLRLEVNLLKQHNFKQYNREYEPGLIADIIREVRDAAKVREDAFFARVKHLMEEQHQQLGLNQMHFLTEKQKNNDRISKLEEQLKSLNLVTNRSENSSLSLTSLNGNNANSARQVLELEREALELRRELQDTRAKKEASDHKIMLLDKKLSNLLRCDEVQSSDASDDGKTESESVSSSGITNASVLSQNPRITLSGPVTDL
ncbi:unnamed protein product [Psylliodes chrysocephalus]|uniref:Uncharacterized protein n=1 Tax=Psylliodes chrysocephalus TaxID=3402493 RepID=A0A9P0D9J1_9CUCU|nr:unnamed protein product [Psylliodes chrysocephala]